MYVRRSYTPGKNDLVCKFYVEPNNIRLEKAAENIAKESSTGTWTDIKSWKITRKRISAKVFEISKKYNTIKIAYPIELFEKGNMPQLMSSVTGNIFGMKLVNNLRLMDIRFPKEYVKSFKGPQLGISGIRKLVGHDRPLTGSIVKPKLGLSEKGHAKVAYKGWKGGLDIIKDDENLTSMEFNSFRKRMDETFRLRDKVEKETGEKKIYMPNITAPVSEMKRRADYVIKKGGEYVMIDIITTGFSAFQEMRDHLEGKKIAIHCHRAGHAAFTRNKKHGISMMSIAKFTRLIGGDQLHTGTIFGKMEGGKEVIDINNYLRSKFYGMKRVFPVASGGLWAGLVPKLVKTLGKDIVIQAGGGVHGHPQGTEAGAKSMKQAVEGFLKGNKNRSELKDYSKELKQAFDKWG